MELRNAPLNAWLQEGVASLAAANKRAGGGVRLLGKEKQKQQAMLSESEEEEEEELGSEEEEEFGSGSEGEDAEVDGMEEDEDEEEIERTEFGPQARPRGAAQDNRADDASGRGARKKRGISSQYVVDSLSLSPSFMILLNRKRTYMFLCWHTLGPGLMCGFFRCASARPG